MTRADYDVAVVGAGPAGSRSARNIAAAGFRVALIEEHRRIGVPSHCSGLISLRTLKEAEIGREAALHEITGAFLHANGTSLALGGGKTRAVVIDRVRWDETLCEQAQSAGADLIHERMVYAERESGGVRLTLESNASQRSLTARLVVGADGAHSRVARSLGMARPTERVYCLGIEGRLQVPRDDFVHVFVGRKLAPGWFGWIIPTGGGGVRVGVGSQGRAKPIECYKRLVEGYPEILRGLEPSRMYGGTIPLTFAPKSYADNVLLVGDAAGQVKPFSGGGIYTGLVAARHAAATAVSALTTDNLSVAYLQRYEKGWKREIGHELLRSLRVRNFGLALDDADVERVVQALRDSKLQALATRHGDIDYPARAILRLARSLPALRVLGPLALRRPHATWDLLMAHLPQV